jgi:hypothetical protein
MILNNPLLFMPYLKIVMEEGLSNRLKELGYY